MSQTFPILGALPRPAECRHCPLDPIATGFSQPEGTCSSGVLGVAEALGAHEAREGLPLRPNAPAGSVFERALRAMGVSRQVFGLWNTIACRPPNNNLVGEWYETQAIEHCQVHMQRVVAQLRPRVMLALGGVPLKALTGLSGEKQTVEYLRGYVLPNIKFPGIPVIATYHPSYIVRGAWNVFGAFMRDIRFALWVAKNGWKEPTLEYNEHADERDLIALRDWLVENPQSEISVDFETDGQENVDEDATLSAAIADLYSEASKKRKKKAERLGTKQIITQVNFSVEIGSAVVCDFAGNRRKHVEEILSLPNPKIGHNYLGFDLDVGCHNGMQTNGPVDDTLLMFHHLYPDLPGKRGKMNDELDGSFANLQYCASFAGHPAPWKHLVKERPEYYGCHDADASLRVFRTTKAEMSALKARNGTSVWDGYNKLVYNISPILKNMQDRGIPVNRNKMMEFLKMLLREQKDVQRDIQRLIPDEMRPYKPKNGYAKAPSDLTDCVSRDILLPSEEKRCCFAVRKKKLAYWADVPGAILYDDTAGKKAGKLYAPKPDCEKCGGVGFLTLPERTETRYVRLAPFNVMSSPQMKMYARVNHHKIPRNSKGEISMDKETLIKMHRRFQDGLYKLAISYREYEKMAGAYALNWMQDTVHTTFTFFPSTGQLSSVNPNVQVTPNPSKYGRLAEEFRKAIEARDHEAPDGCVLIEADKKSYHAQTLGFEAGDPSYIRLAKIDIHSYLATCMLKLPEHEKALDWEDDELKAWLKWYRKNYHLANGDPFEKVRNGKAKPGILGYGFGLGYHKLYLLNEDSFENQREAKLVLDTLDARFPRVAAYRDSIPLVAKRQGNRLISLHGAIRWFWDIGYPHNGKFVHGVDFEKAIAFLPATDAFGDMKFIMRRLEDSGAAERYGMVNQVHDSLIFHCPKKLQEEAIYTVKAEMEKASDVLLFDDGTGLQVDVELKAGPNMLDMKEMA